MTTVFADTFYWIALADRSDSAHQQAFKSRPHTPARPS